MAAGAVSWHVARFAGRFFCLLLLSSGLRKPQAPEVYASNISNYLPAELATCVLTASATKSPPSLPPARFCFFSSCAGILTSRSVFSDGIAFCCSRYAGLLPVSVPPDAFLFSITGLRLPPALQNLTAVSPELYYDRGNHYEFSSVVRELDTAGTLAGNRVSTYPPFPPQVRLTSGP